MSIFLKVVESLKHVSMFLFLDLEAFLQASLSFGYMIYDRVIVLLCHFELLIAIRRFRFCSTGAFVKNVDGGVYISAHDIYLKI